MKTRVALLTLAIISIYVLSCEVWKDDHFIRKIPNSIEFKEKLSEYDLFEGEMKNLSPSNKVIEYNLATPLFTDYASKQRLILLKEGRKMKAKQDGTISFPDSSLLAKTFYYKTSNNEKLILETRLLYFVKEHWNVAVYEWNEDQSEAYLIKEGKKRNIEVLVKGESKSFNYNIPSNNECTTCHQVNNSTLPIGPKIANMNTKSLNGINQLTELVANNYLDLDNIGNIKYLPDWEDESADLSQRARAYLDVNCAHCHRSGGVAEYTDLFLDYQLPMYNTYIPAFNDYIIYRMETENTWEKMPKLGTNLKHKEGIDLIYDFIKTIN